MLGTCGTRSMTVLAVRRDGTAEWRERYRTDGGEWGEVVHCLEVPSLARCGRPGGNGECGSMCEMGQQAQQGDGQSEEGERPGRSRQGEMDGVGEGPGGGEERAASGRSGHPS